MSSSSENVSSVMAFLAKKAGSTSLLLSSAMIHLSGQSLPILSIGLPAASLFISYLEETENQTPLNLEIPDALESVIRFLETGDINDISHLSSGDLQSCIMEYSVYIAGLSLFTLGPNDINLEEKDSTFTNIVLDKLFAYHSSLEKTSIERTVNGLIIFKVLLNNYLYVRRNPHLLRSVTKRLNDATHELKYADWAVPLESYMKKHNLLCAPKEKYD